MPAKGLTIERAKVEIQALNTKLALGETELNNRAQGISMLRNENDRLRSEIEALQAEHGRLSTRLDACLFSMVLMQDAVKTNARSIRFLQKNKESVALAVGGGGWVQERAVTLRYAGKQRQG